MTFKDKDDPDRWNLNNIPGFMENQKPDRYTQLDSVGFTQLDQGDEEFAFKLTDQVSGEDMFDTSKIDLIFMDKYIEFGITLPTQIIFGLGQHNAKFKLQKGNWTMFNSDYDLFEIENGEGIHQLYGTHPFLMTKTIDNKFLGFCFIIQIHNKFTLNSQKLVKVLLLTGLSEEY